MGSEDETARKSDGSAGDGWLTGWDEQRDRDDNGCADDEAEESCAGVVLVTQVIPTDGLVVPPNRHVLTEVFVHRDGCWLVAEGHHTVIEERAQAHDPGK